MHVRHVDLQLASPSVVAVFKFVLELSALFLHVVQLSSQLLYFLVVLLSLDESIVVLNCLQLRPLVLAISSCIFEQGYQLLVLQVGLSCLIRLLFDLLCQIIRNKLHFFLKVLNSFLRLCGFFS